MTTLSASTTSSLLVALLTASSQVNPSASEQADAYLRDPTPSNSNTPAQAKRQAEAAAFANDRRVAG